MLEFISWLVRQLEEALFWLHNKEKDAAVKRIECLARLSEYHAECIKKLDKEKEVVENKYFNEVEE